MSEPRVQLAAIAVHPVKSTAVRPVREAVVEPWGLAGDRRWMVVGPDNRAEGDMGTAKVASQRANQRPVSNARDLRRTSWVCLRARWRQ